MASAFHQREDLQIATNFASLSFSSSFKSQRNTNARANESVCWVWRSRSGHGAAGQGRVGHVRACLREQRSLHKRSGFWEPKHEVHVLDRLTGCALHQVICIASIRHLVIKLNSFL